MPTGQQLSTNYSYRLLIRSGLQYYDGSAAAQKVDVLLINDSRPLSFERQKKEQPNSSLRFCDVFT